MKEDGEWDSRLASVARAERVWSFGVFPGDFLIHSDGHFLLSGFAKFVFVIIPMFPLFLTCFHETRSEANGPFSWRFVAVDGVVVCGLDILPLLGGESFE